MALVKFFSLFFTKSMTKLSELNRPSLYLSEFFERNRASYYDALMRVRVSNDLIHWVKLFLNGVAETATKGRDVFQQILVLRNEVEAQVLGMGRRATNARRLVEFLYRKPVFNAREVGEALDVSTPTANALIREFVDRGFLKETTGQRRGREFAFMPYLRLFLN